VPNSGDFLLLPGFPTELEGRLETVHDVQVPHLDDGLHVANRHQVTLRLRLGIKG
jgi:hypothetical protein